MAFSIRKKSSEKPQAAPASAPPPPSPPVSAMTAAADAAWREKLTAAKPKGRFTYGENITGPRR